MARGRMLDQRFTQSDKLNSVSRDARLVYASVLPYLDREGRACAEPMAVKVNVFRRSDFTIEEITACLAELAAAGLIELYADEDNDAILQYTSFGEFNSPNARERASEYPAPGDATALPLIDPDLLAALAPHDPSTDTPDAPSSTTQAAPTDDARAAHVQRTDKGDAGSVLNVNGNGNVNGERETTSSLSESAPRASELVEAAPRRQGKPPREIQKPSKGTEVRAIDAPYLEAWNEHRGPLPRAKTLDRSRESNLDRLRRELGEEALEVFTDAVKQVATEPYWRQKGYGIGNLLAGGKVLNWAEKWRSSGGMSDSDRRLADKAKAVADAIGGL